MEAASESNGVAALTPGKSPESAWNGTLRWKRTDGQCNVCPAGGGSALWATAIRSALPFLLQAPMSNVHVAVHDQVNDQLTIEVVTISRSNTKFDIHADIGTILQAEEVQDGPPQVASFLSSMNYLCP